MISATFTQPSLVDNDFLQTVRDYTDQFNEKTSVIETVQRWINTSAQRMGLDVSCDIKVEAQRNVHSYKLVDPTSGETVLETSFLTCGPLGSFRGIVQQPRSIGEFNRFLEQINRQVQQPRNAVITDMLRILTVCNESQFLIDCQAEDDMSTLTLDGQRLRQRVEIFVYH